MKPRRSHAAPLAAGLLLALGGCDLLLTEPAPAAPEITLQFQISGTTIGGTAEAFAKVNRLFLSFVRADQSRRDTLLFVRPVDGRLRAGVALESDERISALGIQAELRFGPLPLFGGGAVVPIEPGVPTTAPIPLQPIPARVLASQQTLLLSLAQQVQLSSAVLYATTDTIDGVAGTWSSLAPTVVSVTPAGLAVALGRGPAELIVGFAGLADTVQVLVQ